MDADNARFLKKKLTGGSIDVHPTEKALVVNYEVEAIILSELGAPVLGEKKSCQKVIKVTSLDQNTNIKKMAKEIIEKYKIIHRSKISEVEQILYYLQKRKECSPLLKINTSKGDKVNTKQKSNLGIEDPCFGGDEVKERANINDLEMYLEMMYDDTDEKIRGTALILQLARNSENLDELCQNEILLGALARVLSEEWKNSTQLATYIIYIFFCFSSYTQLHPVVAHFQIGSLCMKIIEQELNKYDNWKDNPKKSVLNKKDPEGSIKSSKQTKHLQQLASKQEQLLRVAFYLLMNLAEDSKVEAKMHKKGIVRLLVRTLQRKHNPELSILVASFLKKLSIVVENKDAMASEDIVGCLTGVLQGSKNHDLTNITLRLLLNLSFDTLLRQQMSQGDLPDKISTIFTTESGEDDDDKLVATCLLYHISMEDAARTALARTPIIPPLLNTILNATRDHQQVEALALCINLSNNATCASFMSNTRTINTLMKKAFKSRDPLLAKLLKNILKHDNLNDQQNENKNEQSLIPKISDLDSEEKSENGAKTDPKKVKNVRRKFINFIGEIADEVKDSFRDDFSAECLGMLAHLRGTELDFSMVLQEYGLVDWIKEQLKVVVAMRNRDVHDDQLTAELVMLIATACMDESAAVMLFDVHLINFLITLLKAKQEDDYMVLLIVTIFHHLILHPSLRETTTTKTEAPAYLIDLIHDSNPQVRKLCATTLDMVGEGDGEWGVRVQSEKFKCHNQHWIEMVEAQLMQRYDHQDEDDVLAFNHTGHTDLSHINHLDHSALLLSRQYYHDQIMAPSDRQLSRHDSFLGGFVEDASALDGTDFYYGDAIDAGLLSDDYAMYRSPSAVGFVGRDTIPPHDSSLYSRRLDDYDAERILSSSYFYGK